MKVNSKPAPFEKPNAKGCGAQKFVSMALSVLPLSAIG
jgi:hypothetical protein